jgi:hypothetical protein
MLKDFDAFFQEMEKKPIEFKLFGQKETMNPSIPATIILKLARAQRQYGDQIPESVQFDLAFSIFSEDKVEEWCNKGLTVDQLAELLKFAMEQYGNKGEDGKKKKSRN